MNFISKRKNKTTLTSETIKQHFVQNSRADICIMFWLGIGVEFYSLVNILQGFGPPPSAKIQQLGRKCVENPQN